MTSPEFNIHSIVFEPDGLVISYIEVPTDVRVKGSAILQHTLRLHAGHPDYGSDGERLHDRAVKVLKNALEDFHDSEPYVPEDDPDDDVDDERGMGE